MVYYLLLRAKARGLAPVNSPSVHHYDGSPRNSLFGNHTLFLLSGAQMHRRGLVLKAETKMTMSRLGVRMPESA